MQLVDLFLILHLAIKTNVGNNFKNIAWIKDNVYNCWYYAINIFGSFFIIKVVKLLVKGKAATIAMQKVKRIFLEVINKA